jgi:hypothetical protein
LGDGATASDALVEFRLSRYDDDVFRCFLCFEIGAEGLGCQHSNEIMRSFLKGFFSVVCSPFLCSVGVAAA